MNEPPFVFDAHLDLAMNACRGRDVLMPAAEQPVVEGEIATVGFPDLHAGRVTHIGAAIFCEPSFNGGTGYTSGDEAYAMARVQLTIYQQWHAAGVIRIHGTPGDTAAPTAVLLMEGADAIRTPDDLALFAAAGVRLIGLSWHATRYAGGTGQPGPLTADGVALVREIDALGLVHDASHLAEQSFWDLFDVARRPIIATHSNCRAIVGDDPRGRHLSDDMIRRVIERGGMIGINFYDKFLLPAAEFSKRRATFADVIRHVRHVCDIAGDAAHVGLGTDMDGGLGRENIPQEVATSADVPTLFDALLAAGFDDAAARGVMGENWRQFSGTRSGRPDVRLVVTADLHFNHARGRPAAVAAVEEINRTPGDALLLVGDTVADDGDALERALDTITFDGPKLFVAGNHELWTRSPDSHALFTEALPAHVRAAGWRWLETEPFEADGVAIVGSIGWYDYRFVPPGLGVPRRFYEAKVSPGAAERLPEYAHLLGDDVSADARDIVVRWNDGQHIRLGRSDDVFLDERLADRCEHRWHRSRRPRWSPRFITCRSPNCCRRGGRRPLDFARAYFGSPRLGELLATDPRVTHVLCGHTHSPADVMIGAIRAINIGSTYERKRVLTINL